MPQPHFLVSTLKKLLRTRGITYRHIAKNIGLSEATIKRQFASGNFTLERLDEIFLLMGLEISDLVRMNDAERHRMKELTEAQEMGLVSDLATLLVAFLVVNGWTFDAILSQYGFSEADLVRCFTKLDAIKLIELLPHNRFKLLTATNFSWRKNGPILRFFVERMQQDYFRSDFTASGEALMYVPGMLTGTSSEAIIKKMETLVSEFNILNQQDAGLPINQRAPYSMVMALRPWKPAIFDKFRK